MFLAYFFVGCEIIFTFVVLYITTKAGKPALINRGGHFYARTSLYTVVSYPRVEC